MIYLIIIMFFVFYFKSKVYYNQKNILINVYTNMKTKNK